MINFRFHLVSLIAVFLALALGIALGATVIDHALVNGLHDQVDNALKERNATRRIDHDLQAEIARQNDAFDSLATVSVQRLVFGRSVLVFAQRGADAASVKQLVALLQRAEATSPAIVWLEPKWKLSDRGARDALTTAIPATATGTTADARRAAFAALAHRVVREPATHTPGALTTTTAVPASDVLDPLRHAGFVSIERAGDAGRNDLSAFGGPDASAVLVVGDGARDPVPQLAATFADSFATSGTGLLVGEVDGGGNDPSSRGGAVAPVRTNADLRTLVSTVDDVDLAAGRIDVVLALADLDAGRVGHYGFGSGAEAAMPAL